MEALSVDSTLVLEDPSRSVLRRRHPGENESTYPSALASELFMASTEG